MPLPHPLKTVLAALLAANSTLLFAAQVCKTTSIPATTPSSRFSVSNGTVTDQQTGLMWKQCSEGLSGAGCTLGTAATFTWQAALQRVPIVNNSGFAGYSDWRLPNVKELSSIVEEQCYSPSINSAVFPNTQQAYGYWSSSPVANYSSLAWVVFFYYGYSNWNYKSNDSYYVRLVRSGQ
jgi:hypothetical protein